MKIDTWASVGYGEKKEKIDENERRIHGPCNVE